MSLDVMLYDDDVLVYDANITHNLQGMAQAAGIYDACWQPDRIGVTRAGQLIRPLKEGLERLKSNPLAFEVYNAPNGWGLYKHLVPWVERYLAACEEWPDAKVQISR